MRCKGVMSAMMGAAALVIANAVAFAHDESKYPDWSGQWQRPQGLGIQWDPSKKLGRDEQAPLTPEYQKVFESGLADQAAGGQGNDPTYTCIPPGMPRAMTVVFPMEIVITPQVTYVLLEYVPMIRRVYTDGRDFSPDEEPSFLGYSVGKWLDTDGDGTFDTLEIETVTLRGRVRSMPAASHCMKTIRP
jgi:hypothetical protein